MPAASLAPLQVFIIQGKDVHQYVAPGSSPRSYKYGQTAASSRGAAQTDDIGMVIHEMLKSYPYLCSPVSPQAGLHGPIKAKCWSLLTPSKTTISILSWHKGNLSHRALAYSQESCPAAEFFG